MPLIKLHVKLQKTEEVTYLQAKNQKTRHRLRYSEVSKTEKRYPIRSQGETTAWKVSLTFLVVINKKNKVGLVYLKFKLQEDSYG